MEDIPQNPAQPEPQQPQSQSQPQPIQTQSPQPAQSQPPIPAQPTPSPTPPPAPPVSPPPQQSQPIQQSTQTGTSQQPAATSQTPKYKITFDFDARTKLTVQWSAIWYAAASGIESLANYFSNYFMGGVIGEISRAFGSYMGTFPVRLLITDIIWGAISGAIAGFILSKAYPYIKDLALRWFKGKINTMFKLLFYPSLIGELIAFLLGGAFAFAIGIGPVVVMIGGSILASFVYAKMLSKKIEAQYEPLV